uniref:Chromatin structure-remodeling complex protein SYD-like isoform X3 n=1 Tax=Rhizophora mucronata TaxID=61149 RepID=A0A2P2ME18_RHIMU
MFSSRHPSQGDRADEVKALQYTSPDPIRDSSNLPSLLLVFVCQLIQIYQSLTHCGLKDHSEHHHLIQGQPLLSYTLEGVTPNILYDLLHLYYCQRNLQ